LERLVGFFCEDSRWSWLLGMLIVLSLAASSRLGKRLPMIIQDVAFMVLVFASVGLPGMAWTAFELLRRSGDLRRWRMGISFFGCLALSMALATPFLCALSSLDWMHTGGYLCLGSSVVAMLAGIFAPGLVRFSLILGGLVVAGLAVIVPIGIL
jgi:hypothetical protein